MHLLCAELFPTHAGVKFPRAEPVEALHGLPPTRVSGVFVCCACRSQPVGWFAHRALCE